MVMCPFEGIASKLPTDPEPGDTEEDRTRKENAKNQTDKAPPALPDLTDVAVQSAYASQLDLARRSQGRRTTFLSAGSVGDTSTLLGGK